MTHYSTIAMRLLVQNACVIEYCCVQSRTYIQPNSHGRLAATRNYKLQVGHVQVKLLQLSAVSHDVPPDVLHKENKANVVYMKGNAMLLPGYTSNHEIKSYSSLWQEWEQL